MTDPERGAVRQFLLGLADGMTASGESTTQVQAILGEVATAYGATPAQIGIAWLLAKSPVMLPIPGTSSVAHLEENIAAADIVLDPADVARLDG